MIWLFAALFALACYLLGSVPFGHLAGRLKGVNIRAAGSGNIGATNAGRVLGRKYGIAVFVLDFLKGALPTAVAVPAATRFDADAPGFFGAAAWWQFIAAFAVFIGHLHPVYLGFRGGKGVACGAGAACVLAPGPIVVAVLVWIVVALASRYVSAASLLALIGLNLARWASRTEPWQGVAMPVSLFLLLASLLITWKHRDNLKRLLQGNENMLGDGPTRQLLLRGSHICGVGIWFGAAAFFNYAVALPTFPWFQEIVRAGPSDRTAYQTIIPADAAPEQKDALASALAGSVVGPIFPRYFAVQGVCSLLVLGSAWAWRRQGRLHRLRFVLSVVAALGVAAGWPISEYVSQIRLARYDLDAAVAAAARAAFVPWHLASLLLSFATTLLAGVLLLMAAAIPAEK